MKHPKSYKGQQAQKRRRVNQVERNLKKQRPFKDASLEDRCQYDIQLRDKSFAQCGRQKAIGEFCTQHAKILKQGDERRK